MPPTYVHAGLDELRGLLAEEREAGAAAAAAVFMPVIERYAKILEDATSAAGLKEWMTVKEAALYVRRSEQTVRRWIEEGMPSSKGDRGHVIRRVDIDRYRTGVPS